MIQGSELPFLSNWQNFYMLIGTAAATLTGLMFVVTTLIAGILSAPWSAFSSISLLLGLFGLGMVFYLIIVMRRMRRVPHYQSTLEDWLWYMAFPLLAHIGLILAAIALPANPALALYIISAAMVLLLFVGIRNAWDLVTFLAVERSHSENKSRD